MSNYRLTIQYDGGRYKGWQRLGKGENTIQGKIENVLSVMTGENIEITGCSRTDAGVHALDQIANFKTDRNFDENEIKDYLNRYLPNDICIIDVKKVLDRFHSRYNALNKTYLYKIWNKSYTNPFIRDYSMHVEEKLNIDKMKEACKYFIGKHDFTAFSNAKSKKNSMVREIYSIDVELVEDLIEIRICGEGFLHNMVRRMVGVLIEVGLEHIEAKSIPGMIVSKDRAQAGYIAEACGLFLEKVEY